MTKLGSGTIFLMVTVTAWGVLLGGVAYSNLFVMPAFLGDLPGSAAVVTGPNAIDETPFWMTIHPIVVLSTAMSLVLNWGKHGRRKAIATSLGVYILVLVITAIYFVPELMAFVASPQSNIPAAEWASRAIRWRTFSWIRAGVMLVSFVPLLFALATRDDAA